MVRRPEGEDKNIIFCDSCKGALKTKETVIETKQIDSGVTCDFFICKHCGTAYVIRIDNERTKELQKEVNEIITKLEKHRRVGKIPPEKLLQNMTKKKRQLNFWIENLIGSYAHLTEGEGSVLRNSDQHLKVEIEKEK